jgi:hypothetical protein
MTRPGPMFLTETGSQAFWDGYAATLARVRSERPSTADAVAQILTAFLPPSAGIAFFGNRADDRLARALADAGWNVTLLEHDYLWHARHPRTGAELHYIEGDVHDGPYPGTGKGQA